MNKEKTILFLIAGLTILVLGGIVLFSLNEGKQASSLGSAVSHSPTDKQRPQAQASSLFADLGSMEVKDEKKAEFAIENKGTKPLQLSRISSSCDCTFAELTIGGVKSPEFGMHSNSSWVGTVDPGKSATLSIFYRPFIMPVKGIVTRDVYVTTNDPEKPTLTFSIKAFVE